MALSFTSSMDDSLFQAGLKSMTRGAIAANDKINAVFKDIGNIPGIGGLAGAFSVGALGMGIKTVLDFSGALQDSSDALGVNVEALQGLHGAFAQAGADAATVDKSLSKLTVSAQGAMSGNENLADSFRRLGISQKDVRDSSPDELLLKISDGFAGATDRGEAYTDMLNVLGKGGKQLASGLSGGREALEEQMKTVDKLSKDEIAALDSAGDAWERFGNTVKVAGGRAISAIMSLYEEGPKNVRGDQEGNKLRHAAMALMGLNDNVASTDAVSDREAAVAREGVDKRQNAVKWAAMRKQYREEDPDASDPMSKLDETLIGTRKAALQKEIEDGNKIYMAGEAERIRIKKDAEANERNLDEANAKQRRSDLQKEVEEGNKLFMDNEEKKLARKKESMARTEQAMGEAVNRFEAAQGAQQAFNLQSPEERMNAQIEQRKEEAATRRQARVDAGMMDPKRHYRDARSGAGKLIAAKKFAIENVQELAKALSKEMAVLVRDIVLAP